MLTFRNEKRYLPVVANPPLECPEEVAYPRAVMVSTSDLMVSKTNHIYKGRKGRATGEAKAAKAFKQLEAINWDSCPCSNCKQAKDIIDNA